MPVDGNRLKSLFLAAAELPPEQRPAFLDQECGDDAELRQQVEALLAAHDASGSFFLEQAPAEDVEANTPTTEERPDVAPGAVVAGRYELVEKLGEGGMGEVWVARQTHPVKRKVALKLIKRGMDSRAVLARFEAERQALALMDHPNIARVLDGGLAAQGRPFFVMELVNGLPLTAFCDQLKLTPRERLELFLPVCHAVQHAHQKGIVHRDLKPSNILVTIIDGRGVAKVIDFGVAKATAGRLTEESLSTQFGAVVGTLEYMAPEQAGFTGQDVDTRADVYSLGVILYELLTGLKPFDGGRLRQAAFDEVIRLLREEEPSKPSTRLSTDEALASLAALRKTEPKRLTALLRGELDWVVMKCLEKQRDRRYESASGLARDIQHYLADEPVEARPPSVAYRVRKFVRRHRGAVAAAALLVLALVTGIVGTTLGLLRAEQMRQDALAAQKAEADQRQAAEAKEQEAREASEQLRVTQEALRRNLYAAQLNLAQSAWEGHGLTRLRELLEEQKPRHGERDRRGFEWHYWDRRAHAEVATRPHAVAYETARVNNRALSPDGRREAVDWGGGWDRTTGQFSGRVEVRDLMSGEPQATIRFTGPAAPPATYARQWVAFTSDSASVLITRLIPGASGASARLHWWLFDAATGRERVPHQEAACEEIGPWQLGADRSRMAAPVRTGAAAKPVRLQLFDLATGQPTVACQGTFDAIETTAFRPDGKEVAAAVATGTGPGLVKVWDTATGKERLSLARATGSVQQLAWSADGRRLAAVPSTLQVWDTADGRLVLTLSGAEEAPSRVAFRPDGEQIACVDAFGPPRFIVLRDTATGRARVTWKLADEVLHGLTFSPDGSRLIALTRFGAVRVWDATVSELPRDLPLPTESPVEAIRPGTWALAFARGAARITAADRGKKEGTVALAVWDRHGQLVLSITRPTGHEPKTLFYHRIALTPDGERVAWAYGPVPMPPAPAPGPGAHRLTVMDVRSGKDLWSIRSDEALAHGFSPDGTSLAATGVTAGNGPATSRTLRLFDAETGRERVSFSTGNALCGRPHFTVDGSRIVTLLAASDGSEPPWRLVVWDVTQGKEVASGTWPAELVETPGMGMTALSPDGSRLAVAWRAYDRGDGLVRLFEVPSGRELPSLKGLDDNISLIAWSADGRRVAAAGRVVKIWDAATGHDLLTLRDSLGAVQWLEFSPDGHRLQAVSWLGGRLELRTWDATPRDRK